MNIHLLIVTVLIALVYITTAAAIENGSSLQIYDSIDQIDNVKNLNPTHRQPNDTSLPIVDSLHLEQQVKQSRPRLNPFCRRTIVRLINGQCTNPFFPLAGSVGIAQITEDEFRDQSTAIFTDRGLPSARTISNIVSDQEEDILNQRGITEFTTYFGQFLDHNLVLTPFNTDEPEPIEIEDDDDELIDAAGGHELGFFRSVRVVDSTAGQNNVVRPENVLTSAVDLVAVYGTNEERLTELRDGDSCKLKVSAGNNLPFNTAGLENAPSTSDEFFLAGDIRVNEHPMLATLHTLFMREHNSICDFITPLLPPTTSQGALFVIARRINFMQYQKIVYEEFIPAMMGTTNLDRYRGFRVLANPTVSTIFSTAAYRIGHTMVGPNVTRVGPGNVALPARPVPEMFFPTGAEVAPEIDIFLRGSLSRPCQETDPFVVDALRNFLFREVEEDEGLDLVALNIQRGRDHALPSYNQIRQAFGRSEVSDFSEISSSDNIVSRLEEAHDSVDDIEAWIGLMSEDLRNGASMGETVFQIWKREFERLRDGDRWFYRLRRTFSLIPRQVRASPFFRRMFFTRGVSNMRDVILRNSGVTSTEMPNNPFRGSV